MNRTKKTFSMITVILLAFAVVFTGCARSTDTGTSTTTSAPAATTKTADATPEPDVLKDPVTVIWYNGGSDQPNAKPVNDKLNEILLKKHNIQLDFRIIDWGTYDEKMNLIISSGEDYDLCFTTQAWVNKYPVQVGKGAFLALDDFLPNYPVLAAALPEFLFEQARTEGKIYAVPNYQITYSQWGFLFRKDLVDESGFDYMNVKSYWDAEPFWKFVQDNYPNLYPTNAVFYDAFANVNHDYIPVEQSTYFKKGDPTYKLSMFIDKEESMTTGMGAYYAGIQNRTMWEKGYLRKDIATVQDETADDAAGKFASIAGVIKPGGEAERKKKSANYDWVQVGVEIPFTTSVASRSAMTAVNALSKHPEEALRMLEIMNTDPEIFNMLNFGVEGVNYKLDNGKVALIDESGYFYNMAWAVGNQFNALLMANQEDGIWEATDKLNREAEITPINGFSFSNANITTEMANVAAVTKEFEKWEYEDDYEERFAQYATKLKAAGADTIVAEVQSQLDAWVAANK